MDRLTAILLLTLAVVAWLAWRKHCTTDKGMGDSVAQAIKSIGMNQTANCGCAARQQVLNQMMPY